MAKNNNPWEGLVPGAVDARRVDSAGKRDFFWWVSEHSEPALILRLGADVEQIAPLPKIRSLDIRYRELGGSSGLVVLLREPEQRQLFAIFCSDIVSAGEEAGSDQDGLARTLRRTLRWYHLLRGGATGLLSLEEQRGLVGELDFLSLLCDHIGPRAAIESWRGPEGSAKDFELHGRLIEVKARRGAARPFVQISSEDQLADVEGARLFLRVYDVDAAVKPDGLTLTDHVRVMDDRFRAADMIAYEMWEAAIEASGFDFDHDYSERRWTVGRCRDFEVLEGFPRVPVPLPGGVQSVRYSVALESCSPFGVEPGELARIIGEVEVNG